MKQRDVLVFAASGLMLMATRTGAHHSFAAVFDRDKPAVFAGVVTKVEWTNPHAHFYIDVTGPSGSAVNWQFELASPNGLVRRGWTRNSLKPGDAVTVDAFLARDGTRYANATTVKLSDGRKVFAGSSVDGGAAQ